MQVSSQSWPKRMMTTRSSSARIAWSTAHPEWRWGSRFKQLNWRITNAAVQSCVHIEKTEEASRRIP
ncbi:hypothetical protein SAY87_002625 [Trapa incisa]|uniref:Uncharacterized protein n=1 Tax=Trapa incisa TaxID=236973 RepID=A0AAN7JUR6_9MYRT|nr:hypothetical protein SAY87_002625 [Trapa incisa]